MKYIIVCLTALAIGIFAIAGSAPEAGAAELWKTLPAPMSAPPDSQTGYAKVNGAEIYYAIYGSGEPLILLHGGLGNTDYWGGQIAAFSAKYKVINIASRGHGRSTRDDQAYSYHLMAKEMASLIPGSTLIIMPNLSHFAMWQDPKAFNAAVLKYLDMK